MMSYDSLSDHAVIDRMVQSCIRAHIARHQTDTVDNALLQGIPRVVMEKTEFEIVSDKTNRKLRHVIGQPFIVKPCIEEDDGSVRAATPSTCRYRGRAYACVMYVPWEEYEYKRQGPLDPWGDPIRVTRYSSPMAIPPSVGSFCCHTADGHGGEDECPYDVGGFFIAKGTEKVIVCPIILQNNHPFIRCIDQNGHWTLQYRSLSDQKKRSTSTIVIHLYAKKGDMAPSIKVTVPFIASPISIAAVLRLLGVPANLESMMQCIFGENYRDQSGHDSCGSRNQSESSDTKYGRIIRLLRVALQDPSISMPMEQLISKIGKTAIKRTTADQRSRTVLNNFANEFLPNMGLPGSKNHLQRKEKMFGFLVWQLLTTYDDTVSQKMKPSAPGSGELPSPTDRDDCRFKRLEHTGGEITYLLRRAWRPYTKIASSMAHKALENGKPQGLQDIAKLTTVQSVLRYALSTGNWGTEKAGSIHTGVSQQRGTLNYEAALSHIDRCTTQGMREGKNPKPRLLHSTQWGVFCPVESPEGEACGLQHNLTSITHVRVGVDADLICGVVLAVDEGYSLPIADCSRDDLRKGIRVTVNGAVEGISLDAEGHVSYLRKLRRVGALPFDTTISLNYHEKSLTVATDPGVNMRPVYNLKYIHQVHNVMQRCTRYGHLLFNTMLLTGVTQYMDKEEETSAQIAYSVTQLNSPQCTATGKYTHAEIHPGMLMGICASMIPYPDKNQAPRNIYGTAMKKQAQGIANINPSKRNDTISYRLWYPQKPLASTRSAEATKTNDLATGQNFIVMVGPFNGNNQEDATVQSKSSLDMGLGRTFYDRTQRDEDGGTGNARARFEQVDQNRYDKSGRPILNYKSANFTGLGEDGLVDPSAMLRKNDCLIGKREHCTDSTKDLSVFYRGREQTQIESVRLIGAENGRKACLIKMATQRRPQVGDKFSSRHGQKGVCGYIAPKEDLPYTADGITPDIMINPHGQPSRMTVGQMIEGVTSKIQAMHPSKACQSNGTAFDNDMLLRDGIDEVIKMGEILISMGFKSMGHEQVFSGVTGKPLGGARLFRYSQEDLAPKGPDSALDMTTKAIAPSVENGTSIFPIYYQPLQHVVSNKIGARQRGPYHPVTLQPVEGRSRSGGLRFGEMEKDAVASHGCARVLRGRLFDNSDAFPVAYCEVCHREGEHRGPRLYCRSCDSFDTCIQTFIPRGFHCAMQESQAMLIGWKLKIASHKDPYA